ncbi:MAG: hypothetical protein P8174_01725 [Gemmatimonadota bacterium]
MSKADMVRRLLLPGVVLLAAGCADAFGPDTHAAEFTQGGVRVALTLEPVVVRQPATLAARLSYTNLLNDDITVSSGMGCDAFVGVYSGNTRISFPATDCACTAAVVYWTLQPGETRTHEWSLRIGPDGVPLAQGHYRFVADLNTHPRSLERLFEVR